MSKRRRRDEAEVRPCSKRPRTGPRLNLLDISDEILLRVFSFLTPKDLLRTEWSRARRIPLGQSQEDSKQIAKTTKWLEYSQRRRDGPLVDWKRQFKIRSNWAAGTARLHEVEVAHPPTPPVIAKVHRGMIFTVDRFAGLRAWLPKDGTRALKAQVRLKSAAEATCMTAETTDGHTNILLGFSDGAVSMYVLDNEGHFQHRYSRHSADGPLMAVALAMPYAMTISTTKFVTLYYLDERKTAEQPSLNISSIVQLRSDASFSPFSLALRRAPSRVIATVAYAFNRIHSGWCMGIQEIRLTTNGTLLDTRLTSTLETPFDARHQGRDNWDLSTRSTSSLPFPLHPQLMGPPTSLSYEHPFLISTLPDNTIMSFLVTSNESKLEISSGKRLWGHTSAVSGAEVNNRGKAVSISFRGNEVRVWELENVMVTTNQPRTSTEIKAVDALSGVVAALARRGSGLGLALHDMKRELGLTRRWVGFDEEQVVVLGERDQKQIMTLYDFT
ncbi:uncharacterized protein Z518_11170 [Rhinocladiella mackenziei CBS 650.93]|uniref:Rhinocladiella mackenziei CBS 650.93 unplaced genomic scaffold supercont1.12, whole genome shotgun sequence n=1 Tax=Rhinocladiella mackenziei CBS 650.93 TaxID=1442369 RepID=A0A0D2FBG1_9EURO|nr:uncharacterized protein Z518_11170 [Rhinocladiella mackenziei CBS 650.93]KIW99431.1 hypothetical protein Z518_11170 [Rhinocladiella mackenziei CBS 650.93]